MKIKSDSHLGPSPLFKAKLIQSTIWAEERKRQADQTSLYIQSSMALFIEEVVKTLVRTEELFSLNPQSSSIEATMDEPEVEGGNHFPLKLLPPNTLALTSKTLQRMKKQSNPRSSP